MKLLRIGAPGEERPALLDSEGGLRDLSPVIPDIAPSTISSEGLAMLRRLSPPSLRKIEGDPRIGPCVAGVSKLVCVGLNYKDHAEETGQAIPKEPVLFMKAVSALAGPNDDVVLPKASKKTDWEVELGIVIGKTAKYVAAHDAMDYVAGYCVVNDLSEREYQFERGGNWSKGKSADGFAPIGPWLVTADEVSDPGSLRLFCEVNGETMQDGTTRNMIFGVAQIVSYISHFMTLTPGDIVPTGTPAGVGFGKKPQRFLKPGDTLRLGVSGLGEQRQRVVAHPD